jgi:hypothetical protein
MANCEDFTITIQNRTGVEIRTTKLEYRDGTETHTEHAFGVDGSDRIDNGRDNKYKRNLQGIGEESTELTVTYQLRSGNDWSANHVVTTDTFTCRDNGSKTITIND